MNQGTVYYRDIKAGTLTCDVDGYTFRYDPICLADFRFPDIKAISL